MTTQPQPSRLPVVAEGVGSPMSLIDTWFEAMLHMQKLQLDAWFSWQQSFADVGQELFDEWACRFGGGAPIDV